MAHASVTSDVDKLMLKLARQAFPTTIRAIEQGVDHVLDPAVAAWPVKTGRSKDAFRKFIRVASQTAVDGIITNPAKTDKGIPYAYYIAQSWTRGSGGRRIQINNRWQQLVVQPMRAQARKVAKETATELVSVMVRNG